MRVRNRLHWMSVLSLGMVACATSAGGTGARTDPNLITLEQLEQLGPGISVYEAIERLRPSWLRDRGMNTASPAYADDTMPKLHVDQTPFPLDNLKSMRTTDIETMRFMSSGDATTRYGTGYVNGLIEVRTRLSRVPGD